VKPYALSACLFVTLFCTSLQAAEVKLEKKGDTVEATIDGQPFTAFNFAKEQAKPYFWPVRAADGTVITRGLENPKDHPHHKGIWLAIDEVNGIKFWAEKGKIENQDIELVAPHGNPARMQVVNRWLGEDGRPVLIESTLISIFADRLMTYDIRFAAAEVPVTFGDTKEGLFGLRLADPLRESQGGRIVNAEGKKGMKECWGQRCDWVDYSGEIEGKTHGVTIFDNPQNPRRSRFHVRDYGLFTISPFGDNAYTNGVEPKNELTLKPGESVRFKYGLYVHAGDLTGGKVADEYQEYLRKAKE
jgi:hypothetical protein